MTVPEPSRYPLEWPFGWPRRASNQRRHSRYEVSFTQARDDLFRELKIGGARAVVLSANIPLRADGLPLSSFREPADPAVALYWTNRRGANLVIACDQWRSTRENIRAIGLTYAAFRAIERTGATDLIARAYSAFARLPPPPLDDPWWQTLGFPEPPPTLPPIHARFRELARTHHPDRGGDPDHFARLSAAYHHAMKEKSR